MPAFNKEPKDNGFLLDQLIGRGLEVPDRDRALRYLKFIGYYRLGAYKVPFEIPESGHRFKAGVRFDDVLNLYIFDRKLRLHTLDALERVEIAIRATLFDAFSLKHGAFWYLDEKNFQSKENIRRLHSDLRDRLESNKHVNPYAHFQQKYPEMDLPPSWVVADLITFGTLSKVYNSFRDTPLKKGVAKVFNLSESQLGSWMHFICYIRNICAHHSLLWNRTFVITPAKVKRLANVLRPNKRYYMVAVVLHDLLGAITSNSSWTNRLAVLMENCPFPPEQAMGFSTGWREDNFWQHKPIM